MTHASSGKAMDAFREKQFDQIADAQDTDQTNDVEVLDRVARLSRRGWFERILDWFYGYDYFITYRWSDGRVYAVALAEQLEQQAFDCFLDSADYAKGDNWKKIGERALKKTSRLVLVGSPHAVRPVPPREPGTDPVLRELEIFTATGKRVIPINFDGTLTAGDNDDPPVTRCLDRDGLWIRESMTQLAIGPTETTLNELRASFNLVRQSEKRSRILRILIAAFATLWVAATVAAVVAFISYRLAEERRLEALRQRNLALGQKLAVIAPDIGIEFREDEVAALVARQAFLYNEQAGGNALSLVDKGLRSVLNRGGFCQRLPGSGGAIQAIAWNSSSGQLATVTSEGRLVIWDLKNPGHKHFTLSDDAFDPLDRDSAQFAELQKTIHWEAYESRLRQEFESSEYLSAENSIALTFSADGDRLLCTYPNSVRMWHVPTRRILELPKEIAGAQVAYYEPNNDLLAVSRDGQLGIWSLGMNTPTLDVEATVDANAVLVGLALSPNGRLVAGIEADGAIQLWNRGEELTVSAKLTSDQQGIGELVQFIGYRGEVAQFTSDSHGLFTTWKDLILYWDLSGGEPEARNITTGRMGNVLSFSLSSDEKTLAVAASLNPLQFGPFESPVQPGRAIFWFYDLANPDRSGPVYGEENIVSAITYSPDGSLVASANVVGDVRLWMLDGEWANHDFASVPDLHLDELPGAGAIAFLDSDRLLICDYLKSRVVSSANPKSQANYITFPWPETKEPREPGVMATVTVPRWPKGSVNLVPEDVDDGLFQKLGGLPYNHIGVRCAAAASLVERVAFGSSLGILLWDRKTNSFGSVPPKLGFISIALSEDGTRMAAVCESKGLWVWKNVRDAAKRVSEDSVGVAMTSDGQWLASSAIGGEVSIWDLNASSLVAKRLPDAGNRGSGSANVINAGLCLQFSSNGRLLAAGGAFNSILVWDMEHLEEAPKRLQGHGDAVTCLEFHPERMELVSGSRDGTVRRWSLSEESAEAIVVTNHQRGVPKLTLSPNGEHVISIGGDGRVRRSVIATSDLARMASRRVRRNLTRAEWHRHIGEGIEYERTVPALPANPGDYR